MGYSLRYLGKEIWLRNSRCNTTTSGCDKHAENILLSCDIWN